VHVLERVLLTLYGVMVGFYSAVFLLRTAGWADPHQWMTSVLARDLGLQALVWGVVFVISLWVVWRSLLRRKHRVRTVVRETGLGQVRIAISALENLAQKTVAEMDGITRVRARVKASEKGIAVALMAVVTPEVSIPEVSEEVQEKVEERMKNVVGIGVDSFKFFVEDITSEARKRNARLRVE